MPRLVRMAFVAGTWLVACAANFVSRPYPITNPAAYREWWNEMELCSGKHFPIDSIHWFIVPPDTEVTYSKALGWGVLADADWDTRRIRVLSTHLFDAPVIRHEAGHILASRGYHDPNIYRRGACAHLVVCAEQCVNDSLPPRR